MTKKPGFLVALAIAAALLTGGQSPAQAQGFGACPRGTQLVPAGRYAVADFCAASAPARSNYDPYTGRNALDPQATHTDGPGQFISKTR
jgi:hypothetical protein